MEKAIAVVSGKGGTGKTTFVSNTGLILKYIGNDITVIDTDMSNSNLGLSLGIYQLPIGIQDVLKGDISLEDSIYLHPTGLKVIPASLSMKFLNNKITTQGLRKMLTGIDGYVMFDSPPGVGEDVLSLLRSVSDIIVITNPQITAAADSLKIIRVAKDVGTNVFGVVVNRSRGRYEMSSQEIESMCEAPVIGQIPEDPMVDRSLYEGVPLVYNKPFSPASIAYKRIACSLVGMNYRPPRLMRIRNMFKSKDHHIM
jgi:cell division ATPase MinD